MKLMQLQDFFAVETTMAEARLRVKNETGGAQLSVKTQADALVIRWQGDVTAETADELEAKTQAQLKNVQPDQQIRIDLEKVAFVDSTGVGLMVRLRKSHLRRNIALRFDHPNENVRNVLRFLKIEEFLLAPPK